MAFSNGYVFGFASVICVVCSVALSGVSLSLRDMQELNRERDLHKNILGALGLPEDGGELDGPKIDELWERRVQQRFITPDNKKAGVDLDQDGDGDLDQDDVDIARNNAKDGAAPAVLSVYVRMDGDSVGAIAMPLNGKGLWGPISGYLALDPSASTVMGVTFAAPKETPGLGAEIQEAKFVDQWTGKKLKTGSGPAPIRVVKGEAANLCPDNLDQCVDGVAGATITSRGVDDMVAAAVQHYDAYLKNPKGAF
jgi:Na+-transporting NADH:ubiquinone oxidoreductase subunit C